MIDELVKEKHNQIDQEETEKMMNIIHRQAYWKNKEDDYQRVIDNMDKEERKEKPNKIKECIQRELEIALLLIISAPLFVMLMFIACK